MPAQRTTIHVANYEEVCHGGSSGFPDDLVEVLVPSADEAEGGLKQDTEIAHAAALSARVVGLDIPIGLPDSTMAVAWEPYQELFQGVIVCLHSDFRIGGTGARAAQPVR